MALTCEWAHAGLLCRVRNSRDGRRSHQGAAGNIGGKLKDAVGGLTGDTQTQAEGKMDQVTGQVQNAYGSAKDMVRDGASSGGSELGRFMSQRPIASLLIAVGVGYVLTRLMHR